MPREALEPEDALLSNEWEKAGVRIGSRKHGVRHKNVKGRIILQPLHPNVENCLWKKHFTEMLENVGKLVRWSK